jgi:hypothetical protein
MKTSEIKELNVIINDIIEEAVESKAKVGRNSLVVKMLMKKFIRKNKLSENAIVEAYFLLEQEARKAKVWKDNRTKSALKEQVAIDVRNFISSLEVVEGNKLTLEDGSNVVVDVIFKKGLTKEQEKTRKEMTA